MKVGSIENPVLVENTWAIVYDSGEISSAQTSITISGLNGNVDEEYVLISRIINGYSGICGVTLHPNNDTVTNYGWQYFAGINATASAARTTATGIFRVGYATVLNNISLSTITLRAKSGFVRTTINESIEDISGTTVTQVLSWGNSWNNTSDNITSLVILASQTNGLGIGSRIILLKKVTNSTGLKTGSLEVQGKIYGVWQKVYENTVGENEGIGGAYDKLICSFDGVDGATTFTAETGQTVTFAGTAQLDTAQSKFGGAALLLDGTGDYVTISDSDNWTFGTGDFTIDCWAYWAAVGAGDFTLWSQWKTGQEAWWLRYSSNTLYLGINNVANAYSVSWTPTVSTWYHIALVRYGSSVKIYIDGVSIVTFDFTGVDIAASTGLLYIGAIEAGSGYEFNGSIDELRISKGIAKWTANFTPPTSAYGVTSKTISGLNGNTDVLYRLVTRVVNGFSGTATYSFRLNNDSATNYGYQDVYGDNVTAGAVRSTQTGIQFSSNSTLNYISFAETLLYVKSGYVRTAIIKSCYNISGTTVGVIKLSGHSYNNTTNNITSMVVSSDQTNGLGIGTFIRLEKLVLN